MWIGSLQYTIIMSLRFLDQLKCPSSCMYVQVPVEACGWCQVSFLTVLHLIFWDKVSHDLELVSSARLAGSSPENSLHFPKTWILCTHQYSQLLSHRLWGSKLSMHACTASILPTEPSSQPDRPFITFEPFFFDSCSIRFLNFCQSRRNMILVKMHIYWSYKFWFVLISRMYFYSFASLCHLSFVKCLFDFV